MMAYKIKLDNFEGPLDLLLHLIREHEMDIYDIQIAPIAEQFYEYLSLMKELNLEVAGDFLVMASQLTYIKSRMLLPKHEDEPEDEEEGEDPRDELVRKLVEYKKFKEAAVGLREKELTQSQVFTRQAGDHDKPDDGELLVEVGVFELIKSFNKVLERFGGGDEYTVTLEEMSVTDKLNSMMSRLENEDSMTFDSLFDRDRGKIEVIATFLALLEIIRLKVARVHQSKAGGEIIIYRSVDYAPQDEEPDEDEYSNGAANADEESTDKSEGDGA